MSTLNLACCILLGAALPAAAAALAAEEALQPLELAPGVFVLAFPDRLDSANAGWIVLDDHVALIGVPHPDAVPRILDEASRTTGKPVREAVVLSTARAAREAGLVLEKKGIAIVADGASPGGGVPAKRVARATRIALGHAAGPSDSVVFVPDARILFAGDVCVNGPRARLPGSKTALWIQALSRLRTLPVKTVVPGRGSHGGPEILERQERFLVELRRQVGHRIAQGWPLAEIRRGVRIEPEWLVWMPYDTPTTEDIDHVHGELTVPVAPFVTEPYSASKTRPLALAIIGDSPHEPGHLEAGLRPAFEAAGAEVRFAVDPRALGAENLGQVKLLVMLRDGYIWPDGPDKPPRAWMTPDQEQAVVAFVERGGGFLALHNATGLYPEGGPYLQLLGGTYQGHGPLERFRVRVVDASHPITREVQEYEVADEQHTPRPDPGKVRIILESRSAGGVTAAAGWVREVEQGRVAYLANGHTRDALGHPMVQRLMRNAMRWCLRLGE